MSRLVVLQTNCYWDVTEVAGRVPPMRAGFYAGLAMPDQRMGAKTAVEELAENSAALQRVVEAVAERITRQPVVLDWLRGATAAAMPCRAPGKQDWSKANKIFVTLFPTGKPRPFNHFNTSNSLKRFVMSTADHLDMRLAACFWLLTCHMLERNPDLERHINLAEASGEVQVFVGDVGRWISAKQVLSVSGAKLPQQTERAAQRPGTLVQHAMHMMSTNSDDRRVARLFDKDSNLARGPLTGLSDAQAIGIAPGNAAVKSTKSYYAIYRYSTIRGEIVKTFMCILPPKSGEVPHYTFRHFYKGLNSELRKTQGPVLHYLRTTYFLGGSSTGTDPQLNGLKLIAIPEGTRNGNHRLLTGLFLSSAGGWQPIVGRLAMLYLGSRSDDQASIMHDAVGIGVRYRSVEDVPPRFAGSKAEARAEPLTLAEDLAHMEKDFEAARGLDKPVSELNECILQMIDNFPDEDRNKSFEGLPRALTIETFAPATD